jgi:hypothetical protein
MKDLRTLIKELSPENRKLLMYAFEEQIPQYVSVGNGIIVGVYLQENPLIKIIESAGAWSKGELSGEVHADSLQK